MRGALIVGVLATFLLSCAGQPEEAIGLAFKARECQDFDLARVEVLKKGDELTEPEIDRVIEINRLATAICGTSMPGLIRQMKGLAP